MYNVFEQDSSYDPAIFEKNEISFAVQRVEENIKALENISYITSLEKEELEIILDSLKEKLYEFNIQNIDF